MSEVTQILNAAQAGDPQAAERLLPLIYDELRRLAAQKLALEKPGQTLDATALVHEAYLRMAGVDPEQNWNNRGHFFTAAAESMRRILIEKARRKQRARHGGGRRRIELDDVQPAGAAADESLLALDEALNRLAIEEPQVAQLVILRYFGGLTIEQAALALGIAVRTANRHWAYARAWLHQQLTD